jgi:AcrR family transcriptional regulator
LGWHSQKIHKRDFGLMVTAGRPREFDERDALEKAMLLFWRKGYRNTSLSDLTAEMAMNRPSIYAAFGDKSLLFQRTLGKYIEEYALKSIAQLDSSDDLNVALGRFLKATAKIFTRKDLPGGCMVACHLSDNELDKETRTLLQNQSERWIEILSARIERAVTQGQLDASQSPLGMASLVVCILSGMSQAARNGASYAQLERTITAFLDVLKR